MNGSRARNIRRTVRRTVRNAVVKQRKEAIDDFCGFVNSQKLGRRIKLALLVIGGKASFEKMDEI